MDYIDPRDVCEDDGTDCGQNNRKDSCVVDDDGYDSSFVAASGYCGDVAGAEDTQPLIEPLIEPEINNTVEDTQPLIDIEPEIIPEVKPVKKIDMRDLDCGTWRYMPVRDKRKVVEVLGCDCGNIETCHPDF